MSVLHVDLETCCEADLRKVGADVYSRDPSLIVTVIAWAFDDNPVQSWIDPWATAGLPPPVIGHLLSGGRFKAWNASFEWAILTNHYKVPLDPSQAICTMQAALHSGLPAALGDAGPAIGANIVKDATAHRLMMQMSKPRTLTPHKTYWHVDEPAKLDALRAYCERDVESERGISKLIAPLPPTEARISALDRAANERGVRIDLDLVHALKALAKSEISILNHECAGLTRGAVTSPGTQVQKLLSWLQARGVKIADLSKEAVQGAFTSLDEALVDPTTRRVLEIRQEVAKSSLKKLDAMARCAGPGDRVRGQLAYYGAFRTGRFAGRLIQPQNFPRPSIKDTKSFIRHALTQGAFGPDPEWTRVAWGNPLDAIASSLRGCLVPGAGKAFVVYDLSQIEARVTAWVAGQRDVLDVFARGEDVYVYMQKRLGLRDRASGKVAVLGLGFGAGYKRFVDMAAKSGVALTLEQSEELVNDWRKANDRIVDFWWTLDRVAKGLLKDFRAATIDRPVNARISLTVSKARNGCCLLTMLLASGRRLYYRNARLELDEKGRDSIVYDGVDQITKRWGPVRTWGSKLCENLVQALARDCIVEAALRIDDLRLGDLVLSVHDELVFEVDATAAEALSAAIKTEIDRRPWWALDLPVASEGHVAWRYGK